MGEMNVDEVFREIFERTQDHEAHVDLRLKTVETAITQVKTETQRRIDKLDERMDQFCKDPRRGAP